MTDKKKENHVKIRAKSPGRYPILVVELPSGELRVAYYETGYDLDLISEVAGRTSLPIIASGGAGSPEHMVAAVHAGASAVLAASIFHFGQYSVAEVKEHMSQAGIPVR